MVLKAEILAVGTEILLGDIVNTNAQFLAKEFHIQHITLQVEQGQKKYPCSQSLIC